MYEVEPGRWLLPLGGGWELEVAVLLGMAWAWLRWRGELVVEMDVVEA
jgi:hypothetical protein